jgi:hypothetical protein
MVQTTFGTEVTSDIEEYDADLKFRGCVNVHDSEEYEDNAEQKFIRTGPQIDLDVPGAHRND